MYRLETLVNFVFTGEFKNPTNVAVCRRTGHILVGR